MTVENYINKLIRIFQSDCQLNYILDINRGVYSENVNISEKIDHSKQLTIKGYHLALFEHRYFEVNCNNIIIDGFVFLSTKVYLNGNNIMIKNCKFVSDNENFNFLEIKGQNVIVVDNIMHCGQSETVRKVKNLNKQLEKSKTNYERFKCIEI